MSNYVTINSLVSQYGLPKKKKFVCKSWMALDYFESSMELPGKKRVQHSFPLFSSESKSYLHSRTVSPNSAAQTVCLLIAFCILLLLLEQVLCSKYSYRSTDAPEQTNVQTHHSQYTSVTATANKYKPLFSLADQMTL